MNEPNPMDATQPTAPRLETPPVENKPVAENPAPSESGKSPRRLSWIWWALAGIIWLLLIAGVSGAGGYFSAIKSRTAYQSTQVSGEAQTQFMLGIQDMSAQRYDLARQRFEYVISIDPNFPGVTDRLADVLLAMVSTATPTVAPTPTVTPTPDLRNTEELFVQAQSALLAGDWTTTIDTLLLLRKRDPTYMTVQVDDMLFVALRSRGIDKIAKQSDLEGGTYDLALAERFGPLDVEANNWRSWAELYIRGASFWDVDWPQAVTYFEQLNQMAPGLMDSSHITSAQRYRLALIGYGDWLAQQGKWCDARDQYKKAAAQGNNPGLQPTSDFASQQCEKPTPQVGPPASQVTHTPTPTGEVSPTLPAQESPTSSPVPPTATDTPPAPTQEPPTATPTP